MISYPAIDPVAFHIGPVAVRWYGIAYLLAFAAGYGILRRLAARGRFPLPPDGVGDLFTSLVLGVIVGGRLGYVLFYNPGYFLQEPVQVFALWEGGMSFHGGLAGVAAALAVFSYRKGASLLGLGDGLALAAPPGLFFGRLANFVNGELYGRVSDVPWAMVFPDGGTLPRHPSQLYEALLEGPVLWLLVWWTGRLAGRREGVRAGVFVCGYGVLRFLVEFTREPDAHLGFVLGPLSMGQVLSVVLILTGVAILWSAVAKRPTGLT